jgi:ribosomal protein S18 acetylase RimI-like enzyme
MNLTTRPVRPEDKPFLFEVYSSTREEELQIVEWTPDEKQAFLRHQFQAQSQHYEARFPDADHRIILHNGKTAGRIFVARGKDEIRLVDIALLAEHRSHGIGSLLLGQLQDEAREAGVPLRHMVEKNNPRAKRFYERLGFRAVDEIATHFLMEWLPRAASDD